MVTPVVKRDAVAHLQVFHGMSARRACQVLGADRTTIRYCSRRTDDEDLRENLRELGTSKNLSHLTLLSDSTFVIRRR